MKTYNVTLTCIYNGSLEIEANSESEAVSIAQEIINSASGFPGEIGDNDVSFDFGEATADYAEEVKDEPEEADN